MRPKSGHPGVSPTDFTDTGPLGVRTYLRVRLPGRVGPLFNAVHGLQHLGPDRDSIRDPYARGTPIDLATVGGIRLDLTREVIEGVNLPRCDNGHVVVGLADPNQINQPEINGPPSHLEKGHNRLWLRLRFAFLGYFG